MGTSSQPADTWGARDVPSYFDLAAARFPVTGQEIANSETPEADNRLLGFERPAWRSLRNERRPSL
jgi:hypothetical protein